MPNFKPVVRHDYTSGNGKARIYIQFNYKGRSRLLKTDYYVEPQYMQKSGNIKDTCPTSNMLNIELTRETNRCFKVFAERRYISADDLMDALRRDDAITSDFYRYAESRIKELDEEKRRSSAGSYRSVVAAMKGFHSRELPFATIDSVFLQKLAEYLVKGGLGVNSAKEYIKKINAIINHATSKNIVDSKVLPERKIALKEEVKPIRLLESQEIRMIYHGIYPVRIKEAVDCWFLSFFLCGMNPMDIYYARVSDVHKDRLVIKRHKTGIPLSIKIVPEVAHIINRYKGKKYLLNFLDKDDSYSTCRILHNATNYHLKKGVASLDLGLELTLAYARSSFATIASAKPLEIPLEVIDAAQGRKIKGETSRYVKYDLDRIDDAQAKVIELITGEERQERPQASS